VPNVIKIDLYNFELYHFKAYAFFATQCKYFTMCSYNSEVTMGGKQRHMPAPGASPHGDATASSRA